MSFALDAKASWHCDEPSQLHSYCSYSVHLFLKKGILVQFFFLFVMPVKSATLPLILCEYGMVSLWHRNSRFPAPRPLSQFSCRVIQRSAMTDWRGSTSKQTISFLEITLFVLFPTQTARKLVCVQLSKTTLIPVLNSFTDAVCTTFSHTEHKTVVLQIKPVDLTR